ncbi:MAG: NAD(P)-dependent oxidoreductase [Planctomycetota bacterium]
MERTWTALYPTFNRKIRLFGRMMARVLVTGATGFIGKRLVTKLCERGVQVDCIVRNVERSREQLPAATNLIHGDLSRRDVLRRATRRVEAVFHLAGTTKAPSAEKFHEANVAGVSNIADACAESSSQPVLIHVSSLAAVHPTKDQRNSQPAPAPPREDARCRPVSMYGHSKLAGEQRLMDIAVRQPVSIVRPPVVFGCGDRDGLEWFRSIGRFGVHLVPGFSHRFHSMVYADDLCDGLILCWKRGVRMNAASPHDGTGVYFVSSPEITRYDQWGEMIAESLGRTWCRKIRVPDRMIHWMGKINGMLNRFRRSPHILSPDKAAEATAGSWICCGEKARSELGFRVGASLQERLHETVRWYRDQRWL